MKKALKIILLIIITFSLFANNTFAAAGFSGNGATSTSTGTGSGGGTSSGWELQLSPIIRFTLVEINEHIIPLNSYVMVNKSGTYHQIFSDARNIDGSGSISGIITEGGYNSGAFGSGNFPEFPADVSFPNDIVKKIASVAKWGLTFDVNELKKSIISSCSGDTCEITNNYEKVVIYMLQKAGIISSSTTKIEEFGSEVLSKLDKYRIIIEPVYALRNSSHTKYMFATPKAIGAKAKESGKNYGIDLSLLYNNLYADEVVGTAINAGGYDTPTTLDEIKTAFADVSHGAGYAIVRLSYNTCFVEETGGDIIFNDALGGKYANDINGGNLEYFINSCTCNSVTNSPLKNQILNSEIKTNIYNNKCNKKFCEYDATTGQYYGKNSEVLGSYTNFITSCGCNHDNVLALKDTFNFEYIANCPIPTLPDPDSSVKSNLKVCTVDNTTENYEIEKKDTKTINTYCSLNCKETINFNDVYGKYSVKAGQYFELGKYPSIIGKKHCEVSVNYTEWYQDYIALANKQADYVTASNRYNAVSYPASYQVNCCSKKEPCYRTQYYAEYTEYHFSGGNFVPNEISLTWGGCTLNGDPYTDPSASSKFYRTVGQMTTLFDNLNSCSEYLSKLDGTTKKETETLYDEYYTYNGELKYYYYQNYSKDGREYRNDARPNNVDDSKLKKTLETWSQSGNYSSYKNPTTNYKYFSSLNSISSRRAGTGRYPSPITRTVEFKYNYTPEKVKAVDIFTAEVLGSSGDTKNKVGLSNVYDTDITAVAKSNNRNYFTFTSLGDDNTIYKWFQDNKLVNINGTDKYSTIDDLTRKCTYEITNDLFKCEELDNCKLNVIYRSVDPSNIDPNDRLDSGVGFSNWKTTNAQVVKKKIEQDAKTKDTYSPENLEYSFTLDSATIATIRKENKSYKYDEWNDTLYKCINGNMCKSQFITDIENNRLEDSSGNPINNILTNSNGRTSWKEIIDIGGNKYTIDGKEIDLNS